MSVADPHLMLSFEGREVPEWLRHRLEVSPPAGITLFREHNLISPDQTAELTQALQDLNSSPLPLLIAIDQEGGQLIGLPGSTPFAGNMAVGAAGDEGLAEEVAELMGTELASVGINVNLAPSVDVASSPGNPSLGIRSFGEDPKRVAAFATATIRGYTRAGILTTAKHFPGKGEAAVDPHYELPILDLDIERLNRVELVPFRAAFDSGVTLLMTGHYAVPALTGSRQTPMSASKTGISDFLRAGIGYQGLVITDALDMGALAQGTEQSATIVEMMSAGTDLLLTMPDREQEERARVAVESAVSGGAISASTLEQSRRRIDMVRRELGRHSLQPGRVGSPGHLDVAARLARLSITLVRDDRNLLPLRLGSDDRLLVLEPAPTNVTPADTTALYPPGLTAALSPRHHLVKGVVYPHHPNRSDIAGLTQEAGRHDLVVVGTVTATPGQTELVGALLDIGMPVITVALRTPYDLAAYPQAGTHLCTYGSHAPSLEALADVILGISSAEGRLPVAIPGLYPVGHRL